jgi:outer membrane protein assembly factor BamB
VYIAGSNANTSTIYALDASTGNLKWSNSYEYPVSSDPVIFNNIVYIGNTVNMLALDAHTGQVKWKFTGNGYEEFQRNFCIVEKAGNIFHSSGSGNQN